MNAAPLPALAAPHPGEPLQEPDNAAAARSMPTTSGQNGFDVDVKADQRSRRDQRQGRNAGRARRLSYNVRGRLRHRRPGAGDVVKKLLSERPPIAGITLPGMPKGSPGMPGEKRGRSRSTPSADGRPPPFTPSSESGLLRDDRADPRTIEIRNDQLTSICDVKSEQRTFRFESNSDSLCWPSWVPSVRFRPLS